VDDYIRILGTVPHADWPDFLTKYSNLPGPRANLRLARAVASVGDLRLFRDLIDTDDEYLTLCGVIGLGRAAADGIQVADNIARLRRHAADPRWRVREGVAMALQRLAPRDCAALAGTWATDPDLLVRRAAVAGLCEPPRLRLDPAAATVAVDLCARVTADLATVPADQRRTEPFRVLRQALGYCWSVAVAADPAHGVPAFRALLTSTDRDVAWIVRSNAGKARLAGLL
jgi:hypothetical protein